MYNTKNHIYKLKYNNFNRDYRDLQMTQFILKKTSPVDVHETNHTFCIHHWSQSYVPQHPIQTNTFQQYIYTLEKWEQQIFPNVNLHRKTFSAIQQIYEHNKAYVVSNGSSKNKKGTYTWILLNETIAVNKDQAQLISCLEQVTNYNPSSYQSEAFGFLLFLRYLYWILQFHHIANFPTIHYFTNNNGLIK